MLAMRGWIEDEEYQLSVVYAAVTLHTLRVGEDEFGPFAIVEEQDGGRHGELGFRVEAEGRDADSAWASVSYYRIPRDLIPGCELTLTDLHYTVHFNPRGLVDGISCCRPRSTRPRPVS